MQSTTLTNGKLERWHGSLKQECIRPGTPLDVEDARRLVTRYVEHYNHVRLHGAIGYIAPADRLAGRASEIHHERDRKLDAARQERCRRRAACRAGEASIACLDGTQRKASGVQGAAMSPLVARTHDMQSSEPN